MAAHDPDVRRQAASTAARARVDRLDAQGRQAMTADARARLDELDLAEADRRAALQGKRLTGKSRTQAAALVRRERASRASAFAKLRKAGTQ